MSPAADRKRSIGREFWDDLPPGRETISYDLRGIGASSRDISEVSLELQVADLAALTDHLKLTSFDLWCFHDAAATGVTFAAQNAERVRSLILYNPWTYVPGAIAQQHIAVWRSFIAADWGVASRSFAQLLYPTGPLEAQRSSTKAIRETQSPEVASLYLEYTNSYDVRGELSRLTMPTLVIGREGPGQTPLVPAATVQEVARGIPTARLVQYDAAAAVCPYFEHRVYSGAVRQFLVDGLREMPLHPTLSPREIEVLRLVARGKTNREIAEELVITRNTVDRHVSHILAKTGSANRAEAVLYAARHRLVE